jgi:hypothetical protein
MREGERERRGTIKSIRERKLAGERELGYPRCLLTETNTYKMYRLANIHNPYG